MQWRRQYHTWIAQSAATPRLGTAQKCKLRVILMSQKILIVIAAKFDVRIYRNEEARCTPAQRATRSVEEQLLMVDITLRFARNETGATAIEYGLIVADISIAIIVAVWGMR
jgi:hypothetical protein